MQLFFGILLALLVAGLAFKAGALSRNGAIAAIITGGLIFGLGGLPWASLLLTFFISSSALSRLFTSRKLDLSEKFSKGSRRDWAQVLANGGLGTLLVLIQQVLPGEIWPWVAYAGAMAAVNADTWATELGVLNPTPPRLVTNWRTVERGTSGGVSTFGSLAALGGALLVAVIASLFPLVGNPFIIIVSAVLGGLGGSFFDSILGATIQSIYWCPKCQKETEHHPLHICGTQTIPFRGWRWLDNDWVNFIASLVGALMCVLVFLLAT